MSLNAEKTRVSLRRHNSSLDSWTWLDTATNKNYAFLNKDVGVCSLVFANKSENNAIVEN